MILEIKILLQRDPLVTLSLKTLMRHKIIAHTVCIDRYIALSHGCPDKKPVQILNNSGL
jgi:hypothetical protein